MQIEITENGTNYKIGEVVELDVVPPSLENKCRVLEVATPTKQRKAKADADKISE